MALTSPKKGSVILYDSNRALVLKISEDNIVLGRSPKEVALYLIKAFMDENHEIHIIANEVSFNGILAISNKETGKYVMKWISDTPEPPEFCELQKQFHRLAELGAFT